MDWALDSKNRHLQPFYRFPFLMYFALIFMPFRWNHMLTRGWYKTQMDIRDGENYEKKKKSTWASCHAGGSIGSGTFLKVLDFFQPPNLS